MTSEQTLVLIKPDGVQRSLAGKIISRFEDTGLKIIAMKMIWADEELAAKHYPLDEEWAKKSYANAKEAYKKQGKKPEHKNHMEFGKAIQSWLIDFLKEGPIVAIVLEGPHAIELTRKIVGNTEPRQAPPETIRGDFASTESYALTDKNKRVLRNLIHASDSQKNAEREIETWFTKKELHAYKKELDKHF